MFQNSVKPCVYQPIISLQNESRFRLVIQEKIKNFENSGTENKKCQNYSVVSVVLPANLDAASNCDYIVTTEEI